MGKPNKIDPYSSGILIMAGEANIRVSKARETSTSSKLDQEQKIRPKEFTLTSKV